MNSSISASFGVAWELLLQGPFEDLRRAMFPSRIAFDRFRHLTANMVLATDIVDKELSA